MRSDFSAFALFTAGLAALVRAQDAPTAGAVRSPGLHEIIKAGSAYTIKWDTNGAASVSLTLLKGPSTNAVPYETIVTGTEDDGEYTWTFPADLPDSNGDTGYGIKLTVDATGAYQYTTQFGISNPNSGAAASSAVASSAAASSAPAAASSVAAADYGSVPAASSTAAGNASYVTEVVTAYTTYCPAATEITHGGKTYTVTAATTLVITDCAGGCTVTKPVYTSAVTVCNDCSKPTTAPAQPTQPAQPAQPAKPSQPAVVVPSTNGTVTYSKPVVPGSATTPAVGTPAKSTPGTPQYTGAAAAVKVGGSFGAAIAMGAAFFAL